MRGVVVMDNRAQSIDLLPPLILAIVLIAISYGYFGGITDLLFAIPGFEWFLSGSVKVVGYTITGGLLLAIVALGVFIVNAARVLSDDDEVDEPGVLGKVASSIQSASAVLLLGLLYLGYRFYFDSPMELVAALWWILPAAILAYFFFVFFQMNRQYANTSTAVNRSQRQIRRSFEDWSEVAIGAVLLFLAAALAVVQGAMAGVSQIGSPLLDFSGEIAYLSTVAIGYATMGGEFWGSWIVPDFSALQWASVALIIGGIALVVRDA